MKNNIKTGLIILNYKTPEESINCIASIKEENELNIYLVDNNSDDGSYEKLMSQFKDRSNIKVVQSLENKGYSAGNNLGASIAINDGCEVLVFANSDVEFYENAIKHMKDYLLSKDNIAITSPKVLNGDKETVRNPIRKIINYTNWRNYTKHPYMRYFQRFSVKKYYNTSYDFIEPLEYEGVFPGCCFAIKTDIFLKLGKFDENVFLYFEEDIMAEKLKIINMKCAIQPKSVIIHFGESSTSKNQCLTKYFFLYSEMYFFRVYKGISNRQLKQLYKINDKLLKNSLLEKNVLDEKRNDLQKLYFELLNKKPKFMLNSFK